jgi:hypothetical protein
LRAKSIIGAALVLLGCTAIPAGAVTNQDGDLITTFDSALRPTTLPRGTPSPVAVRVAGDVRSAKGDVATLPQLRRITVAINHQGRLFSRGLPVCLAREIQPATEAGARAECGDSIIGRGHVVVQMRIPDQGPFLIHANLLAFNGSRKHGHRLILAQTYSSSPPGAFILTFRVHRRRGTFGTVLSAALPRAIRRWAFLTHFDMVLHRVYAYRGRQRSYVSAACSAPPGFDSALFPFAKAIYRFAGGQRLSMSTTATCHVAR